MEKSSKTKRGKKKSFWHKNWQIIKNKKISFRAKNGKFKKKIGKKRFWGKWVDYLKKNQVLGPKRGKCLKKKSFRAKNGASLSKMVKHLKNSQNGYKWFKMAKKC